MIGTSKTKYRRVNKDVDYVPSSREKLPMDGSSGLPMQTIFRCNNNDDESKKRGREKTRLRNIEWIRERRKAIEEGKIDINQIVRANMTLLHMSAYHGDHETIKWLLSQNGIDPNKIEARNDYTALHISIVHGHNNIARTLIRDSRVTIDATTTYGGTPLYNAIKRQNEEIVDLLVKKGANIDAKVDVSFGTFGIRLFDYFLLEASLLEPDRQKSLKLLFSIGAKITSDTIKWAVSKSNIDLDALKLIFAHRDSFENENTFTSVKKELCQIVAEKKSSARNQHIKAIEHLHSVQNKLLNKKMTLKEYYEELAGPEIDLSSAKYDFKKLKEIAAYLEKQCYEEESNVHLAANATLPNSDESFCEHAEPLSTIPMP